MAACLMAGCGGGSSETETGGEPDFVLQDEGSVDLSSATTTTWSTATASTRD